MTENQIIIGESINQAPPPERCGIVGLHTARFYDTNSERGNAMENELHNLELLAPGVFSSLRMEHAKVMRSMKTWEEFMVWLQSEEAQEMKGQYEVRIREHDDHWKQVIKEMDQSYLVRQYERRNKIATAGRAAVAGRLGNITTYTGIINYGALGSSSTAYNSSQTQLVAETARKAVSTTSQSGATVYIDVIFLKAEAVATHQEYGTNIDGTASANTGQLWTRFLTGGWVKPNTESLIVSSQYDFNDATP